MFIRDPHESSSLRRHSNLETGMQSRSKVPTGADPTLGIECGLESALGEEQVVSQLTGGERLGGELFTTLCPPRLCHGTHWVRSYGDRTPENSFLYAVSVLSRWIATPIAPGKVDIILLDTENHIISVGQRTSGKAVTAEKAIFRPQTV
jgi:hypothetical protein